MNVFFSKQKEHISYILQQYFQNKKNELSVLDPIGLNIIDRLLDFSLKGKMIRGTLTVLGYYLFRNPSNSAVYYTGAAMELVQSGLLIHDDIMDKDTQRRGMASLYLQYSELAKENALRDHHHIGKSLGICIGDIAFFLAFELITESEIPQEIQGELLRLCSQELSHVGIAQMLDVYYSGNTKPLPKETVFEIYRYKTARYTFSLPLILGAKLAQTDKEQQHELGRIGEDMGIIFQLKDDELGMLGDEVQLGKPVGSDIKEGKKTLLYTLLMNACTGEEQKVITKIFGNTNLQKEQIELVRSLLRKYHIHQQISEIIQEKVSLLQKRVGSFKATQKQYKGVLNQLLTYIIERTY